MHPNNHSSAPCRIISIQQYCPTSPSLKAISFRTGLTVGRGWTILPPIPYVEPRKNLHLGARTRQEVYRCRIASGSNELWQFHIAGCISPAFSTSTTQPKDPATAAYHPPPRNGGGPARMIRSPPQRTSCCPPRCAGWQLQRCICPAETRRQHQTPDAPCQYTPEAESCACHLRIGLELHTLDAAQRHR